MFYNGSQLGWIVSADAWSRARIIAARYGLVVILVLQGANAFTAGEALGATRFAKAAT